MIGLDAEIERLRAALKTKLFPDVVSNTYASFGRAFIVEKDDVKTPKLQIAGTLKYQDVLPDRKIDGHSFFLPEPDLEPLGGMMVKATVGIYFAVSLKKLYPSVSERAVEYLKRDVVIIIEDYGFILKKEVGGIVEGSKAFEEFVDTKITDNMQPHYLVKFNTEVEYNLKCSN